MKLQIQVNENVKLTTARVKIFGCGSEIDPSSLVFKSVKGKGLKKPTGRTLQWSVLPLHHDDEEGEAQFCKKEQLPDEILVLDCTC